MQLLHCGTAIGTKFIWEHGEESHKEFINEINLFQLSRKS